MSDREYVCGRLDGVPDLGVGAGAASSTAQPTSPTASRARYMMATKAMHRLGDISRDEPDLCLVKDAPGPDYIGNWVCGFGLVEVLFPKATTRPLTSDEVAKWDGQNLSVGSWGYQLHIDADGYHCVATTERAAERKLASTERPEGTNNHPPESMK